MRKHTVALIEHRLKRLKQRREVAEREVISAAARLGAAQMEIELIDMEVADLEHDLAIAKEAPTDG